MGHGFSHILANTVKIEVIWTGPDGATAANIHYALLNTPGAITSGTLGEVAAQMADAETGVSSNGPNEAISSAWTLDHVLTVDNSGASELSDVLIVTRAGSGSSTPLPPQCAVCAGWLISAHYRGGHPRTYFPGIPASDLQTVGGRHLSNTAQAKWTGAGNSMMTEFNTAGPHPSTYTLGTIRASSHGVQLTPPQFFPYQAAVVHTRIDSQRRRSGKET